MNIIDLFSGCGGLSYGFKKAGFNVVLSNEIDEWASETYKKNFPETPLLTNDITKIKDLARLKKEYKLKKIHGIIGGPPCQGFSLAGKRDPKDPRNSLFKEFIRFVEFFNPDFFVMENVKGLLSAKTAADEKVIDIITNQFKKLNYQVDYRILNSADFGVPQKRERLLVVGFKNKYKINYNTVFKKPKIKKYVTVEEAISDLPILESGEGESVSEYTKIPKSTYQKKMRLGSKKVHNHVSMRHTQRLIERFKLIKHGQSVKDVPFSHGATKRGDPTKISGKIFSQNNMRVFPDRPSPTIAASFQSNFIHPFLNRNFTAREGARLQSFPDNFIFCGERTTMSWEKRLSQYKQIGNAVPPLLAEGIAKNIIKNLEK